MDGGKTEKGGGGEAPPIAAKPETAIPPIPSSIAPPQFLSKTYDMVDDPSTDAIISWSPSNNSFVVLNPPEFSDLLPKYFKHNNFSSFVRQLNTYGFKKIDPDRWEFANEGFLRGQKHLLKTISRRKPPHIHNKLHTQQSQTTNSACVEVGKFGLEEEVERLKRDKNVLMQELVRLRQQQQGTDNQLQTMAQRLQGMEQRQQQMMSFLAKAVQSPGFFSQFVQQQSENKRITEGNKKRRIKPEHISKNGTSSSNGGQIVKYQSDKTKALFKQLWDIDDHSHSMSFSEKLDSFPVSGVPSSDMPGKGDSSIPASGEVVHNSAANSENPVISEGLGCKTFAGVAEDQSSLVASTSEVNPNQKAQNLEGLVGTHESASHPQSDFIMDEFPHYPDMPLDDIIDVTDDELLLGPTTFEENVPFPLDIDGIPNEPDIDSFFNEEEELWDMLDEKTEGIDPKTNGAATTLNTSHPAGAGGMDLLTEKMGLLSSELHDL